MEGESVKVFLRLRPNKLHEVSSPAFQYIDYDKSTERMVVIDKNPYVFDHMFYASSTQQSVFNVMVREAANFYFQFLKFCFLL